MMLSNLNSQLKTQVSAAQSLRRQLQVALLDRSQVNTVKSLRKQLQVALLSKCSLSVIKSIVARDQRRHNNNNNNNNANNNNNEERSLEKELANRQGDTPLHIACYTHASLKIVQFLVQQFPQTLEMRNKCQLTPLDVAIVSDSSLEMVQFLDQQNPSILQSRNQKSFGNSVHLACQHAARLDVMEYLVQRSGVTSLQGRDDSLNTPLHLLCLAAVDSCDRQPTPWNKIIYVADQYPAALARSNRDLETPLHLMCRIQQRGGLVPLPIITFVVKLCPEALEVEDRSGNTPLHVLCQAKSVSVEVIQHVVERYPKALGMRNTQKETPLHLACSVTGGGSLPIVRYLIQRYPKALEWPNFHSETPLHLVCQHGMVGNSTTCSSATLEVLELMVHTFPAACLFSFLLDLPVHCLQDGGEVESSSDGEDSGTGDSSGSSMNGYSAAVMANLAAAAGRNHTNNNKCPRRGQELAFMKQATQDAAVALMEALRHVKSMKRLKPSGSSIADSNAAAALTNAAGRSSSSSSEEAALLKSLKPGLSNPEKMPVLLCTSAVGSWLQKRKHYSLVNGIFHLNRAGRKYFHSDAANGFMGVQVLTAVKDDLNALYIHLRENPLLCSLHTARC